MRGTRIKDRRALGQNIGRVQGQGDRRPEPQSGDTAIRSTFSKPRLTERNIEIGVGPRPDFRTPVTVKGNEREDGEEPPLQVPTLRRHPRRTVVDNNLEEHPNPVINVTMLYPVEGILDCETCRAEGRASAFLEARDMVKHMERTHPANILNVVCRGCKMLFAGLNNVRSHRPHCTGEPLPPERGDFPCGNCDRTFQSKRGLSQHEIKAHPNVRNRARIADLQPKPPAPPRARKEWTEEEVALLQRLEEEFTGQRHINKLIEPFFHGTKTNKQISSKRSDLARRFRRRETVPVHAVAADPATEDPVQPEDMERVNSPEAVTTSSVQDIYGTVETLDNDEDEDSAWRMALIASARRTFAKEAGSLS